MFKIPAPVVILWLGVLLVACMPIRPPVASTPPVTTTLPAVSGPTYVPPNWLDLPGGVHLATALSPDNKWLVQSAHELQAIQFVSTTVPTRTLDTQPDPALGKHLYPHAWAPDSSAFVVYGADEGHAGCPYKRVIIYSLETGDSEARHAVFEPYGTEGCITSAWSPDSSLLAVSLNGREIFVINKQAQALQRIVPELSGSSDLSCCWWDKSGLFYLIADSANPAQLTHEIRMVDPTHPENQHIVLNRPGWQLSIVGSAQAPPRLFILERPMEYGNELIEWWVLDLGTGRAERKATLHGSFCASSSSPQSDSVALKVAEEGQACGGNANLWMFNWNRGELINYGRIFSLIGWHTDVQGFVVVKGVYPNDLRFETIKP